MRIKVNFRIIEKELTLPINYQHIVQGWLYCSLDNFELSSELHSHQGFKHFNFSDLLGEFKVNKERNTITFFDTLSVIVSSSNLLFISSFIQYLYRVKRVEFINQPLELIDISEDKEYATFDSVKIKTLAPVTVHTTDEFGKTDYYDLCSEEFLYLLNENAKKKLGIESELKILHLSGFKKINKIVVPYKGFIIVAYKFEAVLSAKQNTINALLDIGLGDRNSIGFGMFKIIK